MATSCSACCSSTRVSVSSDIGPPRRSRPHRRTATGRSAPSGHPRMSEIGPKGRSSGPKRRSSAPKRRRRQPRRSTTSCGTICSPRPASSRRPRPAANRIRISRYEPRWTVPPRGSRAGSTGSRWWRPPFAGRSEPPTGNWACIRKRNANWSAHSTSSGARSETGIATLWRPCPAWRSCTGTKASMRRPNRCSPE